MSELSHQITTPLDNPRLTGKVVEDAVSDDVKEMLAISKICKPSSSIGRKQSLQSKLPYSLVRLWHCIDSQRRDVYPLDANGLYILNADEPQDLT